MLFAERWRHLTYSNDPNFINNALLVAKEYFHLKLSNVTKRATVAYCASLLAVRFAQKRTSGISFIHYNARGLIANFNKTENILNEFESPFDAIAICETWLESDDCTDIMIEGYEVRNVIRKNRKSGGLATYIKLIRVLTLNLSIACPWK